MMPFLKNKEECTGCSACYNICPKNSIQMVQDEEGFFYPEIVGNCIECKRCESVCPKLNVPLNICDFDKSAYAACTKNFDVWKRSASGGAFSEICKVFGDDTTMFVGAAWDGLRVQHQAVVGIDNIKPLCKSKYISSYIGTVFKDIQSYLLNGQKVVFCGTPCQVAGLRNYLGKNFASDNILTIDLICHGVGSPTVFSNCIKQMEQQFGVQIDGYEFRSKRNVFETNYITKIIYGTESKYLINDQYMQLFLKQDCLRPSCGKNCIYRNGNRTGDITIADFKGLEEVFPFLSGEKKNFSTIVCNTPKGFSVVEKLKHEMIMYECGVENIIKYNPLFAKQTWFSGNRNKFFDMFKRNPTEAIVQFTNPATEYRRPMIKKIYDCLPKSLRKILKKTCKKLHLQERNKD